MIHGDQHAVLPDAIAAGPVMLGRKFGNQLELEMHLKSLNRFGLVGSWSDTDLLAGEDWDKKLKAEIADSDIILFLVSANLIANNYIWNDEMPLAKYNKENKNTILIPIILNHCDWQSISLFSECNVVPHKGRPIATFDNRDEAYDEITKQIKLVLEKL